MRDDAIPACPRNWYMLAYSHELKRGAVLSRPLAGIDVVLFRGKATDEVGAFLGHCAHMGCHLKHATVVREGLRCALHHRVISPLGGFLRRDGSVNPDLRQETLPTQERYGCIFVFAGSQAPFALPEPQLCRSGPVQTASMTSHAFDLPWQALIANGMDIEHLQAVHDRRLAEPPRLEQADSQTLRLRYRTKPVGRQLGDRITQFLAKDGVRGSISCAGGSMMLVESEVGRHKAFILLSMCPTGPGHTTVRGVVGVAARNTRLGSILVARAAAWLFHAFLKKDIGVIQDMALHMPASISTPGDEFTQRLYAFMRALPSFSPEAFGETANGGGAARWRGPAERSVLP